MNYNYNLRECSSHPYVSYPSENAYISEGSIYEQRSSVIEPKRSFPLPQTPPFPQNSNLLKRKQPSLNFTPQEESRCVQMVKKALLKWSFPGPSEFEKPIVKAVTPQKVPIIPKEVPRIEREVPIVAVSVLTHRLFNQSFKSTIDVGMGECNVLESNQGGSLSTYGVEPFLAIAVKTANVNGGTSFSALGHFSVEILGFIQDNPTNKIKEFLDLSFHSSPSCEVTMVGMYDQDSLKR